MGCKPRVEWLRWKTARWHGQRVQFVLRPDNTLADFLVRQGATDLLVNGVFHTLWRTPGVVLELRDCVFGKAQQNLITRRRVKRFKLLIPLAEISRWELKPSVQGLADALQKAEEVYSEGILLGRKS